MTVMIEDLATVQKLMQAEAPVKIVDADGKVIGKFMPIETAPPEPYMSEEEIQRRIQAGGGRTLAEIMKDLEKHS